MISFKFYVRVKSRLEVVYERGVNMAHAFDVLLERMPDCAYVSHYEILN